MLLPPDRDYIPKKQLQNALQEAVQTSCTNKSRDRAEPLTKIVVLERETSRRVLSFRKLIDILKETYPLVEFVWARETELVRMSLCETAELFGNARGILGGHGAGLTNMIYLHTSQTNNATVIEFIRDGQAGADYYQNLTQWLGIHHWQMQSVTEVAQTDYKQGGNYKDTKIDLCETDMALRPIFESMSVERVPNEKTLFQYCVLGEDQPQASMTNVTRRLPVS